MATNSTICVTGMVTPLSFRVSTDVSAKLAKRIGGFIQAWEMTPEQFANAVTEHGKYPFTAERIEQMISAR